MTRRFNPEKFRNQEDIHDNPSTRDVELDIRRDTFAGRIRLHFDEKMLRKESADALEEWRREAEDCLENWKKAFGELADEDSKISPEIRSYLENVKMDLPTFDVYTGDDANYQLYNIGFPHESIRPGNFLVVFNLPKPLSHYWWKGEAGKHIPPEKRSKGMVIEWGKLYQGLMPVLWKSRDKLSGLHRINKGGEHDPRHYYYLWELAQYWGGDW
jgi:hypothetical protein